MRINIMIKKVKIVFVMINHHVILAMIVNIMIKIVTISSCHDQSPYHRCHDHRYYDQDTIFKIVTILFCHDQSPYHRCHIQVASLCDGAVYYGELTQQRLLGEDVDVVEDFQQVGGR